MAANGISLHIGLNRVDPVHYDGWSGQLFACENDAMVMEALATKNGFSPKRLFNENATSENLINELKKLSDELVYGDILMITYSGHGGSLPDLNNDEEDEYRNDETWCLFDRQVVDDELFECFCKFRAGVRILMFSDSCHSGTVSRIIPDSNEAAINQDFLEIYKKYQMVPRNIPIQRVGPTYKNNKEKYDPILKKPALPKNSVAAFVVLFAACQDQETAKEWGDHGIFTASLQKMLVTSFNNYNDLFAAVKKAVPQRLQTPNLYKYGNETFDFSDQVPFSIGMKVKEIVPNNRHDSIPEFKNVEEKNTDLIIHSISKSRSTGGETNSIKNESSYELKEEASSISEAWDKAYSHYLSSSDKDLIFVEPNINSKYARISEVSAINRGVDDNNYLNNWPQPDPGDTEFIWHLDDQHSQLRMANQAILDKFGNDFNHEGLKVRIGHIDTGYLDHLSKPSKLMEDIGVSFVKKEFGINKGKDSLNSGYPAEQDGHGCATLAILAGNKIENPEDSYTGYTGYFGAIPFAEVIPIRICETVYNLFNANDVADGIDYAVDNGCEVITMSMAGYPTRRVADAVNRAYEKGVIVVTATGNNWFKGIKKITPKAVMYPARFERVVGVAGACYNQLPYDQQANPWFISRMEAGETMQGNWGPDKIMKTVISGYTPNIPWASYRGKDKFFRSGGGTSSATPQIAAAFALWIVYNRDKMGKIDGTWRKVEAARKAIFGSASKSFPQFKKYYGNGIIRAFDALELFKFSKEELDSLVQSSTAKVKFGGIFQFIGQWFRSKSLTEAGFNVFENDEALREMLSLEIVQLVYRSFEDGGDEDLVKYAEVLEFENDDAADFLHDQEARKAFFDALKRSSSSSSFLKGLIKE